MRIRSSSIHALPMDLIRNDVIIDKMAMYSVGTSYVITKMNFVCVFHDMYLLYNKGKRLVSVIWQCEIVPQKKPDLSFGIDAKPCAFVLKLSMYDSPCPLLQYVNINIANHHLSQYPLYKLSTLSASLVPSTLFRRLFKCPESRVWSV